MRAQLDGVDPNSTERAPANSLSNCDFIHRRTFTASPLLRVLVKILSHRRNRRDRSEQPLSVQP